MHLGPEIQAKGHVRVRRASSRHPGRLSMKDRGRLKGKIIRPRIEVLERRALLSALAESLVTSQSVYQPGQPVQFVFTMTNTSSQPVHVAYGPSDDGFDITQAGALVYQSNAGINPMFIRLDTVQPGQSLTFDGTWNGLSNQASSSSAPQGTFTVTNQLDPSGPSATFQIEAPSSVVPVPATVAAKRATLQIGHPASFILTLTNPGNEPIDLTGARSFTLSRGSTVVWRSTNRTLPARAAQALAPGQSVQIRSRWTGRPNQGGHEAIEPGLYQLTASAGGYTAAMAIRLTR